LSAMVACGPAFAFASPVVWRRAIRFFFCCGWALSQGIYEYSTPHPSARGIFVVLSFPSFLLFFLCLRGFFSFGVHFLLSAAATRNSVPPSTIFDLHPVFKRVPSLYPLFLLVRDLCPNSRLLQGCFFLHSCRSSLWAPFPTWSFFAAPFASLWFSLLCWGLAPLSLHNPPICLFPPPDLCLLASLLLSCLPSGPAFRLLILLPRWGLTLCRA